MAPSLDDLTGLLDRGAFRAELRGVDVGAAILVFDIDRFVRVEECLGTEGGDQLLVELARRLRAAAPPASVLGRLGDDDFGVLLDVSDAVVVSEIAESIRQSMSAPFEVCGYRIVPELTAGFAVLSEGDERDALLGRASAALGRARRAGRKVGSAGPRPMSGGVSDLAVECALRCALDRAELSLHWQPIVALSTNALLGFEALMRWNHPVWGGIPPTRFIPIAEETGLILKMGEWAIELAIEQSRAWRRAHPDREAPSVSVNVSSRQLATMEFYETAKRLAGSGGVDPSQVVLELTESAIVEDPDRAEQMLVALKELGYGLAIDDFGTGYSSLGQLHRFPFDNLKIDRSFVAAMRASPAARTVITSTIQLAHALGLDVTAEGIETADELYRLGALGCDKGQGYFLARPMPSSEAAALIGAGSNRIVSRTKATALAGV